MSPLLTLASDFIERMTNPAYGIRVNEDHAQRFATLLRTEGFSSQFEQEAKLLTSADSLTPHGWLWLLTWARSRNVQLDEELLLTLADTWSSVFMLASVIDVATSAIDELRPRGQKRRLDFETEAEETRRVRPVALQQIDHLFLRTLLQQVTHVHPEAEGLRTGRAEATLVALLQIGSDVTLAAASSLLHHRWRGRDELLTFYRSLYEELDPETQQVWNARLGVTFEAAE